jgi:hypothetical protein
MAKSHLALVAPATVIGTVEPTHRTPKRVRNAEVRAREYLTSASTASSRPPGPIATAIATPPWRCSPTGMAYVRSSW